MLLNKTFAYQAINFNKTLDIPNGLPDDIKMMNPFEKGEALSLSHQFYQKFYNDTNERFLILGINPGRHGAGVTGIPFTDTQRLMNECQIKTELKTYEPSSVFMYNMIKAYGGVKKFYANFYINSPCPLGLLKQQANGSWLNYNYYDSMKVFHFLEKFICQSVEHLLQLPLYLKKVFCLGKGKNKKFLDKLNNKYCWFEEIIPLEHPRYIRQYKSKYTQEYIQKYLSILSI